MRIADKFSFESEKFLQILFKFRTISHKSHAIDKKLANKFQIFQISKYSNVYKSYFSRVRYINFVIFSSCIRHFILPSIQYVELLRSLIDSM